MFLIPESIILKSNLCGDLIYCRGEKKNNKKRTAELKIAVEPMPMLAASTKSRKQDPFQPTWKNGSRCTIRFNTAQASIFKLQDHRWVSWQSNNSYAPRPFSHSLAGSKAHLELRIWSPCLTPTCRVVQRNGHPPAHLYPSELSQARMETPSVLPKPKDVDCSRKRKTKSRVCTYSKARPIHKAR